MAEQDGVRPCELTVTEVAAKYRAGELTPTALMESLLAQVRRLEPFLKAWAWLDEQRAMDAARHAEAEMARSGPRSPLHGIPVGIKDIYCTAGVPTQMGSPIYTGHVPTYDATSVARLRRAGVIIMGKTVTTEFASLQPPQTQNPWSAEHTPGGSSSGSAVAVAALMCPLALGSQTGGSVIRPAAFNGIVGLKPTHGLISAFGVFPVSWSLDTMGVMARSVEDVALALQELAGYDKYDSESVDAPVPDYRHAMHSLGRAPRIGLLRDFFFERSLPEVRRHVEDVCEKLARAGASVEEAKLPISFQAALDAQSVLQGVESAVAHRDTYPRHKEEYGHKVVEQLEGGLHTSGVAYAEARQLQPRFAGEVHDALAPFDALLTPAYAGAAPRDLSVTGDPLFQRGWTFAGVPSLALPSGLDRDGMPLAIQLIARKLDEGRLLAVAAWCEVTLGVRLAPPMAAS